VSLINKMLRELDKRHAPQGGTGAPAGGQSTVLASQLRPVNSGRRFSDLFWYAMAVLMLAAIGWVSWVMWQLTPRPLVTELAYQRAKGPVAPKAAETAPTAKQAEATPQIAAAPGTPVPAATAAAPTQAASVTPAPQPAAAPQAAEPAIKPDMLRLATELATPIPEKRATQRPARAAEAKAARAPATTDSQTLATLKPEATLHQAPQAPKAESGRITRSSAAPRERAEGEYRRAVGLMNQGRVAEGMEGFRAALNSDPGHEAARQTLIALLLEAKRVDDAANVLQEGLALDPKNTGFTMLLARILVERGDVAGALVLLQKHAEAAAGNAEYHAFVAALHQRLGRHREAIDEYQAALKIAPSAGVWWVGLGISSQAANRPKDALEAFRRAKTSGNLAPDLVAFVDQRLRQLQ